VTTTLRDARSGRVIDGRGAIAVAPGRAVRMILIGGAGATLVDAWVSPARWRVEVPPMNLVRRGRAEAPADLPIAFLRWWFCAPIEGELFAAATAGDGTMWLLKDRTAILEVRLASCGSGRLLTVTRRDGRQAERVEECHFGAGPGGPNPNDWVRYEDQRSGLRVELTIESRRDAPLDGEAFRDPDASLGGT
jgi:hypothetical protein